MVIKNTDTDLVFNTFNNFNKFLKFTIEEEIDKKLNYLDMSIFRVENDVAVTDWYQKPTASGRYINFDSHHPISMKKALIYNLTDKVLLLSHEKFHNKNFEIIRTALLNNNYPLDFINKHIKKRSQKKQ